MPGLQGEMDTTTTYNANVELWKEQREHVTRVVPVRLQVKLPVEQQTHLKWEVQFKMSLEATFRHLKLEGASSNQVEAHAGVQAAVHVGAANHETRLRAVHVGAASHETQLQTVDQDMVDAEADHDIADVAVVEHPHPHEDGEYAEWEHPVKGYVDEGRWKDSGSCTSQSTC